MKSPTRIMLARLLNDMGFLDAKAWESGMTNVPSWAYDIAKMILEAGWRK